MARRITVRQPSGACFDLELPEAKSFNALQTLKAAIAARRTARGRDNVGPPFRIAKSVQLTPIRIWFMDVYAYGLKTEPAFCMFLCHSWG